MNTNKPGNLHPPEIQLLLALDGELDPPEFEKITRHAQTCSICGARLAEWKRLSDQIQAYHRSFHVSAPPVPLPQRVQSFAAVRLAVAFSAVAMAVACLFWPFGTKHPPVTIAPPPVVVQDFQAAPPSAHPSVISRKPSRHKRTSIAAAPNSGFIALPFSDTALPLAGATVVRVQMPIEELQSTGLPVINARPGAAVQADVLVGIDGLPRGIRLVHLIQ